MKDDNFSGTQSGEAMKYKLFGLEQRTKTKEGLFTKGLRRRAKLLETILKNTRSLTHKDLILLDTYTTETYLILMKN
ncbi:phage portal, SPP1 Gp6-like family protein [Staphylococcus aureus subsp. aureus CIG1057]|nr:phage portal, SPP1 Gp6-like family protein [Staphylococcus aureus subsp. aureus CIG1057]